MNDNDAIKAIFLLLFLGVLFYLSLAAAVFQWRNPTANEWSFFRDFSSVIRFEKLPKYQGIK